MLGAVDADAMGLQRLRANSSSAISNILLAKGRMNALKLLEAL